MVRGDTVAAIGLVDSARDEEIDWKNVSAPPLNPVHMTMY